MIQSQNIKPEALVIQKASRPHWNYNTSVKTVQSLCISWKSISTDLLQELWVAKQALTLNGARQNGRTKNGALSWATYVQACFEGAISKRSIDSYLEVYSSANFTKPPKPSILTDHSKLVVRNIQKDGDMIRFELFLPEYNVSYSQAVSIE